MRGVSDPARRTWIVRMLSFPEDMPRPLLVLIAVSSSLVGVFFVPLLLPEGSSAWVHAIAAALVVFGLMVVTAALLRRAHARGRERR